MSLALGIPHRLCVPATPEGRWLAELARRLFGPRGPKLTMAGLARGITQKLPTSADPKPSP
jgi:hypothetical protein